jgi:hypothetical protein
VPLGDYAAQGTSKVAQWDSKGTITGLMAKVIIYNHRIIIIVCSYLHVVEGVRQVPTVITCAVPRNTCRVTARVA